MSSNRDPKDSPVRRRFIVIAPGHSIEYLSKGLGELYFLLGGAEPNVSLEHERGKTGRRLRILLEQRSHLVKGTARRTQEIFGREGEPVATHWILREAERFQDRRVESVSAGCGLDDSLDTVAFSTVLHMGQKALVLERPDMVVEPLAGETQLVGDGTRRTGGSWSA